MIFDFHTGGDIKITAVDFEAIQLPACCYSLPALYISSKWFNYFGVLTGIAFDWGYWYMTALPFRPCDYLCGNRTDAVTGTTSRGAPEM